MATAARRIYAGSRSSSGLCTWCPTFCFVSVVAASSMCGFGQISDGICRFKPVTYRAVVTSTHLSASALLECWKRILESRLAHFLYWSDCAAVFESCSTRMPGMAMRWRQLFHFSWSENLAYTLYNPKLSPVIFASSRSLPYNGIQPMYIKFDLHLHICFQLDLLPFHHLVFFMTLVYHVSCSDRVNIFMLYFCSVLF